jgi:hypothetical protein
VAVMMSHLTWTSRKTENSGRGTQSRTLARRIAAAVRVCTWHAQSRATLGSRRQPEYAFGRWEPSPVHSAAAAHPLYAFH